MDECQVTCQRTNQKASTKMKKKHTQGKKKARYETRPSLTTERGKLQRKRRGRDGLKRPRIGEGNAEARWKRPKAKNNNGMCEPSACESFKSLIKGRRGERLSACSGLTASTRSRMKRHETNQRTTVAQIDSTEKRAPTHDITHSNPKAGRW